MRAAEQAGYSGAYQTLASIANTLLKKVEIKAAIDDLLAETLMSEMEIDSCLADIARADIGEIMEMDASSRMVPSAKLAVEKGMTHLIKGFDQHGRPILHDRLAALKELRAGYEKVRNGSSQAPEQTLNYFREVNVRHEKR